jgi:23S rRNA (uracil1939-C5)-methyltransferase
MSLVEVRLTGITHGGSAVGKYEGRAIFVPYGIPGELVRVRIIQDKARYAVAEIVEVIEASDTRIEPRCRHFGQCGGCHWQHIMYTAQLALKQRIVREQMSRIGGFQDVTVYPTLPSPVPWSYRLHSTFHMADDGTPGFVGTDNRSVVTVEECWIIRDEIWECAKRLRQNNSAGERLRIQIRTEGQPIVFVLEGDDFPQSSSDKSEPVYYTVKGRRFRCSPGSFFQANLSQAEVLVEKTMDYLDLHGGEKILELYSGVGLFTAFLADRAENVTSVEGSPSAVQDAKANLAEFENVTLIEGKIEHVLSFLKNSRYDAAVLDPPRGGANPLVLQTLVQCAPDQIIYVSCDPATLARDSKRLCELGYTLLSVQPVDMFPQTFHIECVARFQK